MRHKTRDFVKLCVWAEVASSDECLALINNPTGGSIEAACVASTMIEQKDGHKSHSGA